MKKAAVIALDSGTTSSRALLCDLQGNILHISRRGIKQYYPENGYVEEDPEEIFSAAVYCIRDVLAFAEAGGYEAVSLGITNQRETVIVWERETGKHVCPAIVWQCRRSAEICEALKKSGWEQRIYGKTGLVIDAYFSASKLKWLFDRRPELRRKAYEGSLICGTVDSYLIWRLTGGKVHATDTTNASRTMLFNIHSMSYDTDLAELFGIPLQMLPAVKNTADDYGICDIKLFEKNICIRAAVGDQQSALFGQSCKAEGSAKCTYGTGCFMLVNTGSSIVVSNNRLLSGIAWTIGGRTSYCLEGSVFTGGAAVQWLRDGLGIIKTSEEINTVASTVPDSGGVVFVPAFVGLSAPYWDSKARGLVCGLTRATTAAHICRAVLESIAFQVNDIINCINEDCEANNLPVTVGELKADGGAAASDILMQFQADISDKKIICPIEAEKTALGAAELAIIGTGINEEGFMNPGEKTKPREFLPHIKKDNAEKLRNEWKNAIKRTLSE
ncbi:MAG: glycerol kinase GlpK [Oscillospiraceae bacterium]|nr:glycerol kinase GlpK [Oscillospiraceae bacterium]